MTIHSDLWTFESDTSAFGLPEMVTRLLLPEEAVFDVWACRGTQCYQRVGVELRHLTEVSQELRSSAMLIRSRRKQGAHSHNSLAVRFILSPTHPSWLGQGAELPEGNQIERDILRIARSVQASVAWNDPGAFPTIVSGVRERALGGVVGKSEQELLAESLASTSCPRMRGVIDILPRGSLRRGLREFLAEHPLRASLLKGGLDRLHDYVLSTHDEPSQTLMGSLQACGAVRREIPGGELLYLPAGHRNDMESALVRQHLLPLTQDASARTANATLGEFMLPSGRLFLSRRRSLELAGRGYSVPFGAGDERLLLPLEEHCAKLGLAEDNALEVVVQRAHALRLRELLVAWEKEPQRDGASSERMIAGYSRALSQWPCGGFFGASTDDFLELLRRLIGSIEPRGATFKE